MEQKQPLQQMVLGDLDSYVQKNETLSPTYAIHRNKFKMDKRLTITYDTIKVVEENIGRKISDIPRSNIFTDMSPKARDIKSILRNQRHSCTPTMKQQKPKSGKKSHLI